jgi:hypothetical protein
MPPLSGPEKHRQKVLYGMPAGMPAKRSALLRKQSLPLFEKGWL